MTARLTVLCAVLVVTLIPISATVTAQEKKKETLNEEVFRLVNEYRVKNKLPPLKVNKILAETAQKHAENLAKKDRYGDDNTGHLMDGKMPQDRAKAAGYDLDFVGENCHLNQNATNPVQLAVKEWVKSKPHRVAMTGTYSETGVGVARSASGKLYFVQVFGRPEGGGFTATFENQTGEEVLLRSKGAKKAQRFPAGARVALKNRGGHREQLMEVAPAGGKGTVASFTASLRATYVITGNAKDGFKVTEKK